jgi:hypothetical protein
MRQRPRPTPPRPGPRPADGGADERPVAAATACSTKPAGLHRWRLRTTTTTTAAVTTCSPPAWARPAWPGRGAHLRQRARAHRGRAAPRGHLQQLPRHRRHDGGRRLRHAVRPQRGGRRHGDGSGEGKIAGTEYHRLQPTTAAGRENVTLMVQVPASFDPARPASSPPPRRARAACTAPSATGEWGLKRGCAVAYTDKGTGNGAHDLRQRHRAADRRHARHGGQRRQRRPAFDAGLTRPSSPPSMRPRPTALPSSTRTRSRNPEKDWGRHTLQAVEFAFYVLNERYGEH